MLAGRFITCFRAASMAAPYCFLRSVLGLLRRYRVFLANDTSPILYAAGERREDDS